MNNILKLPLIIVTGLLLVAGIVTFFVNSSDKKGKIQVSTVSVPSDSIIKVNGKEVGKNFSVNPGEYTISGSKNGFETYDYKIKFSKDESEKKLFFVLSPQSESAKEWADKNQKLYREVEQQAGEQAQIEGAEITEKYPIISFLPVDRGYFRIDYKQDPATQEITVQITGDAAGRQIALSTIRGWGIEPTDYKVEFRGFTSIYENSGETTSQ
jgi:hypothetical protein